MQNLDELKIELNTSVSVDQRKYNAPAMDQVAAIWQDGSDEKNKFKRSIMVFPNSGGPQFIRAFHGCYDSLAYCNTPVLILVLILWLIANHGLVIVDSTQLQPNCEHVFLRNPNSESIFTQYQSGTTNLLLQLLFWPNSKFQWKILSFGQLKVEYGIIGRVWPGPVRLVWGAGQTGRLPCSA